ADDRRLRRRNWAFNTATPLRHNHCARRRSDIDRYTAALVRSVGGYYRNGRTGATNARRTVHSPPSAGSVEATACGIASAGAIRLMRRTGLFVLSQKWLTASPHNSRRVDRKATRSLDHLWSLG